MEPKAVADSRATSSDGNAGETYHGCVRQLARSLDRELLDDAGLDPVELRRNLGEMAMLNRLPGGVASSVSAVLRVLDPGLAVLDIGTGFAEFAHRLRRRARTPIVLADVDPAVLAVARSNVAGMDDVTLLEADVRALPLKDGAVGVAHSSLLLHHLEPADAVTAMREMRRVARNGVVLNDLRRSRLAFALTAAPILALARARSTRPDGLLSARRAYTVSELDDLAADAGLRPVARTVAWWPRVTTTYR
jgi:SAM-dependent methyltransferase